MPDGERSHVSPDHAASVLAAEGDSHTKGLRRLEEGFADQPFLLAFNILLALGLADRLQKRARRTGLDIGTVLGEPADEIATDILERLVSPSKSGGLQPVYELVLQVGYKHACQRVEEANHQVNSQMEALHRQRLPLDRHKRADRLAEICAKVRELARGRNPYPELNHYRDAIKKFIKGGSTERGDLLIESGDFQYLAEATLYKTLEPYASRNAPLPLSLFDASLLRSFYSPLYLQSKREDAMLHTEAPLELEGTPFLAERQYIDWLARQLYGLKLY